MKWTPYCKSLWIKASAKWHVMWCNIEQLPESIDTDHLQIIVMEESRPINSVKLTVGACARCSTRCPDKDITPTMGIGCVWFAPTAMTVCAERLISPCFTPFIYFSQEHHFLFLLRGVETTASHPCNHILTAHPPCILSTWSATLISLLHNHWTMICFVEPTERTADRLWMWPSWIAASLAEVNTHPHQHAVCRANLPTTLHPGL